MDGNQPSTAEVKEFYDDFLDARMLSYRLRRNLRIIRATERVLPYIQSGSRVLEIGCGIGMVSEQIGRKISEGRVWACDISSKNVEYATRTVRSRKIDFFTADILNDFEAIEERISGTIDVFVLIDVLEHLPLTSHCAVFAGLRRIASPDSMIILTFPSPQYQQHLRDHEPDELQIIDEVIELETLLTSARPAGFSLRHFSLEDIWRRNQYVHCVLQSNTEVDRMPRPRVSPLRRVLGLGRRSIARYLGWQRASDVGRRTTI